MPTIWTLVGFVGLSAILGLLVMARTRPSLASYGWRRPIRLRRIGFGLPLVAVLPIIAVTAGFHVTAPEAVAYAALTVVVGVNEEVWFRGLVLAALRSLGTRTAIVTGAALFGLLHLANAGNGKSPLYLLLQAVFAAEVGLVLGLIVAITRSLWVGIAWHFVYDLTAYCTGDGLDARALVGIAVMMTLLAAYGVWLWARLGADPGDLTSPSAARRR